VQVVSVTAHRDVIQCMSQLSRFAMSDHAPSLRIATRTYNLSNILRLK
jgi:hypothetical protein